MPHAKDVDAWFARYTNPMKEVVMFVRDIILDADPRITECIKWQAPTFVFEGNLASFFPKSKQHASLMFHQGALIPGDHPRLEGTGGTGRVMKLASIEEAAAARRDLTRLVKTWCDWRTGGAGAPAGRAASAKAKPAKTAPARAKTAPAKARAKPAPAKARAKPAPARAKARTKPAKPRSR